MILLKYKIMILTPLKINMIKFKKIHQNLILFKKHKSLLQIVQFIKKFLEKLLRKKKMKILMKTKLK